MKRYLTIALLCAFGVAGCNQKANEVDADNTKKNERDKSDQTKTPGDQAENEADRNITQEIRKGVVGAKSLSQTAKNVKIITKDGVVTLRGPVNSEDEKSEIATLAQNAPGVKRVDNQLEIKSN